MGPIANEMDCWPMGFDRIAKFQVEPFLFSQQATSLSDQFGSGVELRHSSRHSNVVRTRAVGYAVERHIQLNVDHTVAEM